MVALLDHTAHASCARTEKAVYLSARVLVNGKADSQK